MSVFVDIIEEGSKKPKQLGGTETDDFTTLQFRRKNVGFQAKVGDNTTLRGKPLSYAKVTGVTEGPDDTVDIYLKNKAITNSEIGVEGGGALDLEVHLTKGGNPQNKGKSLFAKNKVTGSDKNDSIKFVKARFIGNEVDLGKGSDSITFQANTVLRGQNIIDFGDDSRKDIIKFVMENDDEPYTSGTLPEPVEGPVGRLEIKNFGKEDLIRFRNNATGEVFEYDYDAAKTFVDGPDYADSYWRIEFKD